MERRVLCFSVLVFARCIVVSCLVFCCVVLNATYYMVKLISHPHCFTLLHTTTQGWPRSSLYITKKYEELKEAHKGWPDR